MERVIACRSQQLLRHRFATQVEVAILEAHLLADLVIELERQRLGLVQHFELAREQLDLARTQVRVRGGTRARTHQTLHADHELAAQTLGVLEHLGGVRIEHHLQQTFAVAQVDEDHSAMVTATMHPTGNGDLLAREFFVDESAVVGAHGANLGGFWERGMLPEMTLITAGRPFS